MRRSTVKILTEAQTAELLRCSRDLLKKWRLLGFGPRYFRLGRRAIRYRLDWLEDYMLAHATNAPEQESRAGTRPQDPAVASHPAQPDQPEARG